MTDRATPDRAKTAPCFRVARATDAETLTEFNRSMAHETEGRSLALDVVRAGVAGVFSAPGRGFYVVATDGDEIIGSLMITFEWSDWRNAAYWWIQSVYVRPAARRRGVYRGLYRFVLDRARSEDAVCGFRLYVEKDNQAAQAVYEALGMSESNYLMYEVNT